MIYCTYVSLGKCYFYEITTATHALIYFAEIKELLTFLSAILVHLF